MVKNKIVAIYARANDKFALEKQIKELKMVCKKKNYKVYEIYTEQNVSGRTLDNRYRFKEMMEDLKEKKFETIMVYEPSRIVRNISIWENFLKEIKKYDCNLELPTGTYEEVYSDLLKQYEIINNLIKNNVAFYCRVGRKEHL